MVRIMDFKVKAVLNPILFLCTGRNKPPPCILNPDSYLMLNETENCFLKEGMKCIHV